MAPFLAMAELKQALFLLIWLNENVPFHGTFSRHGITRASLALLIWLNENVENVVSKKLDGHRTPTEVHMYSDRGTHVPRPRYTCTPTEVRKRSDRNRADASKLFG